MSTQELLEKAKAKYMTDEDVAFYSDLGFDDLLAAVYGIILEHGDDPDEVLREWGVLE